MGDRSEMVRVRQGIDGTARRLALVLCRARLGPGSLPGCSSEGRQNPATNTTHRGRHYCRDVRSASTFSACCAGWSQLFLTCFARRLFTLISLIAIRTKKLKAWRPQPPHSGCHMRSSWPGNKNKHECLYVLFFAFGAFFCALCCLCIVFKDLGLVRVDARKASLERRKLVRRRVWCDVLPDIVTFLRPGVTKRGPLLGFFDRTMLGTCR